MPIHFNRFLSAAIISSGLILSACVSTGVNDTKTVAKPLNNNDYYEADYEGRIYVFDDTNTYLTFLEVGETAYRKVFIGAGPHGKTLVFGLTKEDKKKTSGIASMDMYHGKLTGADPFYGEVQTDGRIYVFNSWQDLISFKQVGEAVYRLTQIGAGPNGKTIVYVLNKSNKKQRPLALISQFKKIHSIK
ncbi:MAG: hypothetical protein GXP22_11790 [Gammaproteobacteria bacterium]|nr:hypothetical protein [Gammaproteobacteria bacterium]